MVMVKHLGEACRYSILPNINNFLFFMAIHQLAVVVRLVLLNSCKGWFSPGWCPGMVFITEYLSFNDM